MKFLITKAIQERRLVRLTYDGLTRTVEPHVLGRTYDHREALLCRQVSPPMRQAEYWRLLYLANISNLRLLDAPIEASPEGPVPPLGDFSTTDAVLQR